MSGFGLKRPCPHCPFRTDIPGYLAVGRGAEIARSLAAGAVFPCHKTTVPDPDDDSQNMGTPESQFCAGALIVLERQDTPNQAMRTAERLGLYDAGQLDMQAPVASTLIEFARHHDGTEEGEEQICSVVGPDCEAPAGYLEGGIVIPAEPTGEVHTCPDCGESVCESCSDDAGRCEDCAAHQLEEAQNAT